MIAPPQLPSLSQPQGLQAASNSPALPLQQYPDRAHSLPVFENSPVLVKHSLSPVVIEKMA